MLIPHTPSFRGKKSAAWQSWTSLHVLSWTQRANPEGTWVTSGSCGGATRNRVIPSSAHTAYWLQFYEGNAQEKKCEEVSSVISSQRGESRRTGHCIWILRTSLRLSVIGYYGSLAFIKAKSGTAFTCLSTTDPCIHCVEMPRESVERVFQPLRWIMS